MGTGDSELSQHEAQDREKRPDGPGGLGAFSDSLADAVETAGRSVVRVEARRRGGPSSGIVWSDGVIIAADHNVEEVDTFDVGLAGGRVVKGSIAGRDGATDLVVIRADTDGAPPAAWAESASIRAGSLALSLSRPGPAIRAALATVSVVGGEWRTHAAGRIERYIEAEAPIRSGFSGGLLTDLEGHAIGLQTAGLVRNTAIVVPESALGRVAHAILATGRVERGFLGVSTYPVRLPAPLEAAVGQRSALLVLSVSAASPAEKGGVLLGDAIVAVGGRAVSRPGDLLARLMDEKSGTASTVRVIRAGEVREIAVTIGSRD